MILFEQVIFDSTQCADVINSIVKWEQAGLYVKKNETEYNLLLKPNLRKSLRSEITIEIGNPIFENLKLALNNIGFEIKSTKLNGAVLKYGVGDFLYKHNDLTDHNNTRLACCVVQLNNFTDYTGGELVIYSDTTEIIANKSIGNVIIFKPEVMHETKEILSGERYSLVVWALAEDVVFTKRNNLI